MQAYWEFFTGDNHMDSTKNEIPDGKLSFDIDVPKAEDLELEGTAAHPGQDGPHVLFLPKNTAVQNENKLKSRARGLS